MKNVLFSFFAIVLFSINGNAQKETDQTGKNTFKEAELKTVINGEEITYKFKTLEDFEAGTDKIIEDTVNPSNSTNRDGDDCNVTITMTVTVTLNASVGIAGGSTSVTVTGSVTTTCANAVAAGKALKKQLIAMAQG
jgi:hypothetical protein